MTLKLRIFPRAERDIQCIFDYIAGRTPEGRNNGGMLFVSSDHPRPIKSCPAPVRSGKLADPLRTPAILIQDASRTKISRDFHRCRR